MPRRAACAGNRSVLQDVNDELVDLKKSAELGENVTGRKRFRMVGRKMTLPVIEEGRKVQRKGSVDRMPIPSDYGYYDALLRPGKSLKITF